MHCVQYFLKLIYYRENHILEVENSPGISISVLTKDDQEMMKIDKITEVMKVWKDIPDRFKVKGVSFFQKMKEGRRELDCCLILSSTSNEGIQ